MENHVIERMNQSLPNTSHEVRHPYGVNPEIVNNVCVEPAVHAPKVCLTDRILNQEALVISYCAERNLPFSCAGEILDISKELCRDRNALQRTQLHRTTASYKLQYGVSTTIESHLNSILKDTFFSLNIDEATSATLRKVLTVFVSYFDAEKQMVVVRHLDSVNVPSVNTENVYNVLIKIFAEKELPWKNCLAILMDSCAVMRGSKNGLEKRIRETVCPDLLDIDGDTCHHIHNASKQFTSCFESYLEELFSSLYTDFKWSEDQRVVLESMYSHLGVTYRRPELYSGTRWLTVHDIAVQHQYDMDALVVFYFSFLSKEDKSLYQSRLQLIYEKLTDEDGISALKTLQGSFNKKKQHAEAGRKRKSSITEKLFHTRKETCLQLSLYSSALVYLKQYVMLFQQAEPAIHKLHDNQVRVIREFLACFIKPEILSQCNSISKLSQRY